jgi:hypothetical protein
LPTGEGFTESRRCNFIEINLGEPEIIRSLGCARRRFDVLPGEQSMFYALIQFATAHPLVTVLVIGMLSLIVMRAAIN